MDVYDCICVHTGICTCGDQRMAYISSPLLDCLSQAFSLHWKLTCQLGKLFRKHQRPSCLCLSRFGIVHAPPLFLTWAPGIHFRPSCLHIAVWCSHKHGQRAQPCVFTFNSSVENGSPYYVSQFHVSFSFQTSFQLLHSVHHHHQTAAFAPELTKMESLHWLILDPPTLRSICSVDHSFFPSLSRLLL